MRYLYLLFFILFFSGCLSSKPTEQVPIALPNTLPEVTSAQLRLMELYQPNRDSYGDGIYWNFRTNTTTKFRIRDVAEKELPPLPEDFWKYKYVLLTKGFLNFSNLSEEYWKQPEFVEICTGTDVGSCVNSFKQNAIPYFKEKNIGIWFREGTLTFPAVQYVTTVAGAEFSIYVIWQTAWNVETYQGIKLVSIYPNTLAGNVVGNYNILDGKEKIKVVEISPEMLLLEPTYPIVKKDYRQLVKITFKVAEDIPKGDYMVAFEEVRLPKNVEEQYYTKYLDLYQPKSSLTSVNVPKLQVIISVR
mgnify:CR=1 FL=1